MFNVKIVSCSIVVCLAGLYSSLALAAAVPPTVADVMNAIYGKNHSVLEAFIKAGGNVNQPDQNGQYLLNIAASVGDIEAMDELIKAGANINAQTGRTGLTPLMRAALLGHPEAVALGTQDGQRLLVAALHEQTVAPGQQRPLFITEGIYGPKIGRSHSRVPKLQVLLHLVGAGLVGFRMIPPQRIQHLPDRLHLSSALARRRPARCINSPGQFFSSATWRK